MENKTRSRVMLAITLFSAIVLSGTVFVCARRAGEEVTQRSFDELTTATKQLAKDINNATRTDQTILSAMAELIAGQDEDDLDSVLRIMNTFSLDKTFVSTDAPHSSNCVSTFCSMGNLYAIAFTKRFCVFCSSRGNNSTSEIRYFTRSRRSAAFILS